MRRWLSRSHTSVARALWSRRLSTQGEAPHPRRPAPEKAEESPANAGDSQTASARKPHDRYAGLSLEDRYLLDPTLDPLYKQKAAAKAVGAFGVFLVFMGVMHLFEKQLKAEAEEKKKKKEEPKFSIFVPQTQQGGGAAGMVQSFEQTSLPLPPPPPPPPAQPETAPIAPDFNSTQPLLETLRKLEEQGAALGGDDGPQAVQKVFTTVGVDEKEEELSELDGLLLEELELQGRLKRLRGLKRSPEVDEEKRLVKGEIRRVTDALARVPRSR